MVEQRQVKQAGSKNQQAFSSLLPDSTLQAPVRTRNYAYYKEIFNGRPMPYAYLDLDLMWENIQQIRAQAGTKTIRLATKSLRSVAIIKRILAVGPIFQGLMCYHPQEAVYLVKHNLDDLLLGYPIWNEADIAAIARATAEGARITLMVDSPEHVDQIDRIAQRYDVMIPLCLDIDMSTSFPSLHFGVWRSAVRTTTQLRPILERIEASSNVKLDGLMGYEAQIAGVGDNAPGHGTRNAVIQFLKRRSLTEIAERRAELVAAIRDFGFPLRFVNGGGTGSISTTRQEEAVTEITVGSGFYAPTLFDNYRDFHFQPAAGFAIEIVRQPSPTLYTCLGGGYVASGAAGADKLPQPYLPTGCKLDLLEGAGEVQTPIRYSGPLALNLGDPIFMRHSKAGELCERFKQLALITDGEIVEEVRTYRGDGQSFM